MRVVTTAGNVAAGADAKASGFRSFNTATGFSSDAHGDFGHNAAYGDGANAEWWQ